MHMPPDATTLASRFKARRKSCCYACVFQFQIGVEHTSHYLDVTHLKILIILNSWHKDRDITLIIVNFATILK